MTLEQLSVRLHRPRPTGTAWLDIVCTVLMVLLLFTTWQRVSTSGSVIWELAPSSAMRPSGLIAVVAVAAVSILINIYRRFTWLSLTLLAIYGFFIYAAIEGTNQLHDMIFAGRHAMPEHPMVTNFYIIPLIVATVQAMGIVISWMFSFIDTFNRTNRNWRLQLAIALAGLAGGVVAFWVVEGWVGYDANNLMHRLLSQNSFTGFLFIVFSMFTAPLMIVAGCYNAYAIFQIQRYDAWQASRNPPTMEAALSSDSTENSENPGNSENPENSDLAAENDTDQIDYTTEEPKSWLWCWWPTLIAVALHLALVGRIVWEQQFRNDGFVDTATQEQVDEEFAAQVGDEDDLDEASDVAVDEDADYDFGHLGGTTSSTRFGSFDVCLPSEFDLVLSSEEEATFDWHGIHGELSLYEPGNRIFIRGKEFTPANALDLFRAENHFAAIEDGAETLDANDVGYYGDMDTDVERASDIASCTSEGDMDKYCLIFTYNHGGHMLGMRVTGPSKYQLQEVEKAVARTR